MNVKQALSYIYSKPIFFVSKRLIWDAYIEPHKWITATLEKIPLQQTPIDWDELLP